MVYTTLNRTKKQTSSTSGPMAESLPASVAKKSQCTQPTTIEAEEKGAPLQPGQIVMAKRVQLKLNKANMLVFLAENL